MFPSHPSRNGAQHRPGRPLPEVAESECPTSADEPGRATARLSDEAAFKVLLKRNLRPQSPPPELLGAIRARIDTLRARGED
ncbi:hypothetical protein [Neolewinella sp.]|uniref:hypothetical protein n=1 Tax=Neolewinella sp. TaxID=2993543 RepID=UPI003B52239E